jgi:hypothetical protein
MCGGKVAAIVADTTGLQPPWASATSCDRTVLIARQVEDGNQGAPLPTHLASLLAECE